MRLATRGDIYAFEKDGNEINTKKADSSLFGGLRSSGFKLFSYSVEAWI